MKILHLYHDIMNLYGEYANVKAMERIFGNSGITYTTDRLSIGADVDISAYDFIYIGSGTERNQRVVLEDMKKYKEDLEKYIYNGKTALFTGNSFEMLGHSITDSNGQNYEGLGIFDFTVKEQNKTRITADAVFECDFLDKPLVGFINKCSEIQNIGTPLFNVKMGIGNTAEDNYEGIRVQNFFGTHLTGPVLIKNPYFLEYIVSLIAGENAKLNTEYLTYERAGYEVTLKELEKRVKETNG